MDVQLIGQHAGTVVADDHAHALPDLNRVVPAGDLDDRVVAGAVPLLVQTHGDAFPGRVVDGLVNLVAGNAAQFEALQADANPDAEELDLDVILDVPVKLSLEVGRTRIPIRNLLQLNQGSVVELERGVGDPLDVFINGTLVAHGEVVVVNDRFGVRLTDVVSPSERIRRLR